MVVIPHPGPKIYGKAAPFGRRWTPEEWARYRAAEESARLAAAKAAEPRPSVLDMPAGTLAAAPARAPPPKAPAPPVVVEKPAPPPVGVGIAAVPGIVAPKEPRPYALEVTGPAQALAAKRFMAEFERKRAIKAEEEIVAKRERFGAARAREYTARARAIREAKYEKGIAPYAGHVAVAAGLEFAEPWRLGAYVPKEKGKAIMIETEKRGKVPMAVYERYKKPTPLRKWTMKAKPGEVKRYEKAFKEQTGYTYKEQKEMIAQAGTSAALWTAAFVPGAMALARVAPVAARVSPLAAKAIPYVPSAAFAGYVGVSRLERARREKIPWQEEIAKGIVEVAAVETGFKAAPRAITGVRRMYRRIGAKYVPPEKAIAPGVLAEKEVFPTVKGPREAITKFRKARYEVVHATEAAWPRETITLPGKRAYPGLYVTPWGELSAHFLRVPPKAKAPVPIKYEVGIAPKLAVPTAVKLELKRVKRLPPALRRAPPAKFEAFITRAKEPVGYVPPTMEMGKTELEAIIPPGLGIRLAKERMGRIARIKGYRYYTEFRGEVIPIREYEFVKPRKAAPARLARQVKRITAEQRRFAEYAYKPTKRIGVGRYVITPPRYVTPKRYPAYKAPKYKPPIYPVYKPPVYKPPKYEPTIYKPPYKPAYKPPTYKPFYYPAYKPPAFKPPKYPAFKPGVIPFYLPRFKIREYKPPKGIGVKVIKGYTASLLGIMRAARTGEFLKEIPKTPATGFGIRMPIDPQVILKKLKKRGMII